MGMLTHGVRHTAHTMQTLHSVHLSMKYDQKQNNKYWFSDIHIWFFEFLKNAHGVQSMQHNVHTLGNLDWLGDQNFLINPNFPDIEQGWNPPSPGENGMMTDKAEGEQRGEHGKEVAERREQWGEQLPPLLHGFPLGTLNINRNAIFRGTR